MNKILKKIKQKPDQYRELKCWIDFILKQFKIVLIDNQGQIFSQILYAYPN